MDQNKAYRPMQERGGTILRPYGFLCMDFDANNFHKCFKGIKN